MALFYICRHPYNAIHGPRTVTFAGNDYAGIESAGGEQGLVEKGSFEETPTIDERAMQIGRPSSWPESPFSHEDGEARHYPGTHWEAFFDDPKTIIQSKPEGIVQGARPWIGGVDREAPRPSPGWMGSWDRTCMAGATTGTDGGNRHRRTKCFRKLLSLRHGWCAKQPDHPAGQKHRSRLKSENT